MDSRALAEHYQHKSGGKLFIKGDDFFSPTKPAGYVALRLIKTKEFYQRRIPLYSAVRIFLTVATFACAGASAILARFNASELVPIVSAFSAAVTAWIEFRDLDRKLERYSRSVRDIRNLVSWWSSLSEVEKASPENASRLVMQGEGIIRGEFSAWSSSATPASQPEAKGEGDGEKAVESMSKKERDSAKGAGVAANV
mmetsp:Transcript_7134/g.18715  ORF Transcript_7134/g.18715 Transcript_7134/m.18715 type:complete len:198 (-) Transcript_7134:123-716(-)